MKRSLLLITLLLLIVPVALSQDESRYTPEQVHLEGFDQIWQQLNRCASAALTIQMSYYDWDGTYSDAMRWLNPYAGDVSVRIEQMAGFAEFEGYSAVVRTGGTIDLLKQLAAAEFPVLVENVYYDGPNGWDDWMSHNRVLVGYDDLMQTLYFYDSLLGFGDDGLGRQISYAEFDERWHPFNRDYMIIYLPEREEELMAILGDQWDETYNAEWTLQQAEADWETLEDSFSLFNQGSALVALERYDEAAAKYDEALDMGLPYRMLWYEFGPFEAYLAVGRTEDVKQLVYQVLDRTYGVEEMYYYIGKAYEADGDTQRAIANYQLAVDRSNGFPDATRALSALASQ